MAKPIIQKTGSVSGPSAAGKGSNDLVPGETVDLVNLEPSHAAGVHFWEFVDVPLDAESVTILNPTTKTPSFVVHADATFAGSYEVKLTVDGVEFDTEIFGKPLTETGGRIPAHKEQSQYDEGGNTKGWHEAETKFKRSVDEKLPVASKLTTTTGPTTMPIGAVADGEFLKRDGANIVGASAGGGIVIPHIIKTGDGTASVGADAAIVLTHGDNGGVVADVSATGSGAFAAGLVVSDPGDSTEILASGDGAFAFGDAFRTAEIKAVGSGAWAGGRSAESFGMPASIDSDGNGSMTHGFAEGGTLRAYGPGSHVLGHAYYGGYIGTSAAGRGAFAGGFTSYNGTVVSNHRGSFAFGYAKDGFAFGLGARIEAANKGAWAGGSAQAGGYGQPSYIRASGQGSLAFGNVTGDGYPTFTTLEATGPGSVAFGAVSLSGLISSTGIGAFAGGRSVGHVSGGSQATILAGSQGSFVHGQCSQGFTASSAYLKTTGYGYGATVLGRAVANNNEAAGILADALGSFAGGNADNAFIKSKGAGSFAFGSALDEGLISAGNFGTGAFAFGHAADTDSEVLALYTGDFAGGQATGGGRIHSDGKGGFAFGRAHGSYSNIFSRHYGSVAIGFTDGDESEINSQGRASFAMGHLKGGLLRAQADGSLAMGYIGHTTALAQLSSINSNGDGAQAFGRAVSSGTGGDVASMIEVGVLGHGSQAWGNAELGGLIGSFGPGGFAGGNVTGGGGLLGTESIIRTGSIPEAYSGGRGAFAFGVADSAGAPLAVSTIEATVDGAWAAGYAKSSGSSTAKIHATAFGAMSHGHAFGNDASGLGVLEASGVGAHAFGFANSATIVAAGDGAFASGLAGDTGAITASGNGSFAMGHLDDATLQATSPGAHARGSAVGGFYSALIQATGWGSTASGYCQYGRIEATGHGAFAFGHNYAGDGIAKISASGNGSFAHGWNSIEGGRSGDNYILASGYGSTAQGYNYNVNVIKATGGGSMASGGGTYGTIWAAGNGSHALGYSRWYSTIKSTGRGSFSGGYVNSVNPASESLVEAFGQGSFAFGQATATGLVPGTVRATGVASFALGQAIAADILASGKSCFAQGYADKAAAITAGSSYGASFAQGYATGAGTSITSSNKGTFAQGAARYGGNITASDWGAFAQGNADGGDSYGTASIVASERGAFAQGHVYADVAASVAGILANDFGSFASGYATASSTGVAGINATGPGAHAFGYAFSGNVSFPGTILASGRGSLATGGATNGLVEALGAGSFAMGYADDSAIRATSTGSFAMGEAFAAGKIVSSADGSFAGGYANAYNIYASGGGAFAFGKASAADIIASADNAFQLGEGTNAVPDSLQVGTGFQARADGRFGGLPKSLTLGVAAVTFATTSNTMIITGDAGANTIATITGGFEGQEMNLLFVDALVTVTDDNSHAANTIDLSAAFTSADDTLLRLLFVGGSWYEVSRSVN